MKRYEAYCFDLDGTLYKGNEPIADAIDAVKALQQRGIEPFYVTNNASVDRESVVSTLAQFGLKVPSSHVMTTAVAAALYCRTHHGGQSIYLHGEEGLHRAFEREGLHITTERTADVAVVGIRRDVTYDNLTYVMNVIRNGATFIGTNGDRIIPTADGFGIGNGSFVHLLSYATGVEPIMIGKPEPPMLELIQQFGSFSKDEMVMIGDNYDTDIQLGIRYGIDTIHVAGGVHSTEDVENRAIRPTYMMSSLRELIE